MYVVCNCVDLCVYEYTGYIYIYIILYIYNYVFIIFVIKTTFACCARAYGTVGILNNYTVAEHSSETTIHVDQV